MSAPVSRGQLAPTAPTVPAPSRPSITRLDTSLMLPPCNYLTRVRNHGRQAKRVSSMRCITSRPNDPSCQEIAPGRQASQTPDSTFPGRRRRSPTPRQSPLPRPPPKDPAGRRLIPSPRCVVPHRNPWSMVTASRVARRTACTSNAIAWPSWALIPRKNPGSPPTPRARRAMRAFATQPREGRPGASPQVHRAQNGAVNAASAPRHRPNRWDPLKPRQ